MGDLNVDLTISLRHELVIGSDTDGDVQLTGGGSAANVAAWATGAGTPARFVGPLGEDHLGDYLINEMTSRGVHLVATKRAGQQTRSVAALIGPDGNRSLVSDQNNLIALEPTDFDAAWFKGVDWLHLTAYTFIAEQSRELFVKLTSHALSNGIGFSIDPSAAELLRSNCDHAQVITAFSDAGVLFPSHDEAEYLTGLSDPVEAAKQLLALADCVAVTCGPDGVVVAQRDQEPFSVSARPTELVNTLGCGDAFVAGFLSARLDGLSTPACADRGLDVAAQATRIVSAR